MQSAGYFAASSLSRLPVPFIKGKWPKARGDRDRWHGKAVTDEGAGFGLRLLCAGEFRRLRAASDFAHGGKVTKTPPGTAPDEHFVLIVAFPRTPFTGVTPWGGQNISGAQNLSGFLRFLPGHWALGFWKIGVGAIPQPRLGLPSQHAWFETRDTSSAPFGGTFP